ncbi:MAG: flagellar hook capping FlgD N-terminal domain-containing protein [Planctomycetaceae bacterium]
MEVGATSNTTNAGNQFVDKADTGFNGLKPEDFLLMLITQLQNQDPTQPTSNEELLSQLSMMQSLTSSRDLADTIEELNTTQQQAVESQKLTNAAGLIGKQITGINESGFTVSGLVDRAFMNEGEAYLGSGANILPLSSVIGVNLAG